MAKINEVSIFKIGGYGLGSSLAMILSFDKWHSILWAIVHGVLSWIYVFYYATKYTAGI